MADGMIPGWGVERRRAFLKTPVAFAHRMAETGLFTPDGLASILDAHPDGMLDINLYEIGEQGMPKVRTGSRGGATGLELLAAAREGRLWMNLRQATRVHARLGKAMDAFMAELSTLNPGFRPVGAYGNLLLSAPHARVPYHADTPGVCLVHLEGRKRIWVYPNHGRTLADEAMERVALRENGEDLPYHPVFEEDAQTFDLTPGTALVWPINAPHRVDNLGTFNVSLSIEFMTWEARLRHGAYYANGTLRRRFGLAPPPVHAVGPAGRAARWALAKAFQALRINKAHEARWAADFGLVKDEPANA